MVHLCALNYRLYFCPPELWEIGLDFQNWKQKPMSHYGNFFEPHLAFGEMTNRQAPANLVCEQVLEIDFVFISVPTLMYGFLKLVHVMCKTETESQFQNGKIINILQV